MQRDVAQTTKKDIKMQPQKDLVLHSALTKESRSENAFNNSTVENRTNHKQNTNKADNVTSTDLVEDKINSNVLKNSNPGNRNSYNDPLNLLTNQSTVFSKKRTLSLSLFLVKSKTIPDPRLANLVKNGQKESGVKLLKCVKFTASAHQCNSKIVPNRANETRQNSFSNLLSADFDTNASFLNPKKPFVAENITKNQVNSTTSKSDSAPFFKTPIRSPGYPLVFSPTPDFNMTESINKKPANCSCKYKCVCVKDVNSCNKPKDPRLKNSRLYAKLSVSKDLQYDVPPLLERVDLNHENSSFSKTTGKRTSNRSLSDSSLNMQSGYTFDEWRKQSYIHLDNFQYHSSDNHVIVNESNKNTELKSGSPRDVTKNSNSLTKSAPENEKYSCTDTECRKLENQKKISITDYKKRLASQHSKGVASCGSSHEDVVITDTNFSSECIEIKKTDSNAAENEVDNSEISSRELDHEVSNAPPCVNKNLGLSTPTKEDTSINNISDFTSSSIVESIHSGKELFSVNGCKKKDTVANNCNFLASGSKNFSVNEIETKCYPEEIASKDVDVSSEDKQQDHSVQYNTNFMEGDANIKDQITSVSEHKTSSADEGRIDAKRQVPCSFTTFNELPSNATDLIAKNISGNEREIEGKQVMIDDKKFSKCSKVKENSSNCAIIVPEEENVIGSYAYETICGVSTIKNFPQDCSVENLECILEKTKNLGSSISASNVSSTVEPNSKNSNVTTTEREKTITKSTISSMPINKSSHGECEYGENSSQISQNVAAIIKSDRKSLTSIVNKNNSFNSITTDTQNMSSSNTIPREIQSEFHSFSHTEEKNAESGSNDIKNTKCVNFLKKSNVKNDGSSCYEIQPHIKNRLRKKTKIDEIIESMNIKNSLSGSKKNSPVKRRVTFENDNVMCKKSNSPKLDFIHSIISKTDCPQNKNLTFTVTKRKTEISKSMENKCSSSVESDTVECKEREIEKKKHTRLKCSSPSVLNKKADILNIKRFKKKDFKSNASQELNLVPENKKSSNKNMKNNILGENSVISHIFDPKKLDIVPLKKVERNNAMKRKGEKNNASALCSYEAKAKNNSSLLTSHNKIVADVKTKCFKKNSKLKVHQFKNQPSRKTKSSRSVVFNKNHSPDTSKCTTNKKNSIETSDDLNTVPNAIISPAENSTSFYTMLFKKKLSDFKIPVKKDQNSYAHSSIKSVTRKSEKNFNNTSDLKVPKLKIKKILTSPNSPKDPLFFIETEKDESKNPNKNVLTSKPEDKLTKRKIKNKLNLKSFKKRKCSDYTSKPVEKPYLSQSISSRVKLNRRTLEKKNQNSDRKNIVAQNKVSYTKPYKEDIDFECGTHCQKIKFSSKNTNMPGHQKHHYRVKGKLKEMHSKDSDFVSMDKNQSISKIISAKMKRDLSNSKSQKLKRDFRKALNSKIPETNEINLKDSNYKNIKSFLHTKFNDNSKMSTTHEKVKLNGFKKKIFHNDYQKNHRVIKKSKNKAIKRLNHKKSVHSSCNSCTNYPIINNNNYYFCSFKSPINSENKLCENNIYPPPIPFNVYNNCTISEEKEKPSNLYDLNITQPHSSKFLDVKTEYTSVGGQVKHKVNQGNILPDELNCQSKKNSNLLIENFPNENVSFNDLNAKRKNASNTAKKLKKKTQKTAISKCINQPHNSNIVECYLIKQKEIEQRARELDTSIQHTFAHQNEKYLNNYHAEDVGQWTKPLITQEINVLNNIKLELNSKDNGRQEKPESAVMCQNSPRFDFSIGCGMFGNMSWFDTNYVPVQKKNYKLCDRTSKNKIKKTVNPIFKLNSKLRLKKEKAKNHFRITNAFLELLWKTDSWNYFKLERSLNCVSLDTILSYFQSSVKYKEVNFLGDKSVLLSAFKKRDRTDNIRDSFVYELLKRSRNESSVSNCYKSGLCKTLASKLCPIMTDPKCSSENKSSIFHLIRLNISYSRLLESAKNLVQNNTSSVSPTSPKSRVSGPITLKDKTNEGGVECNNINSISNQSKGFDFSAKPLFGPIDGEEEILLRYDAFESKSKHKLYKNRNEFNNKMFKDRLFFKQKGIFQAYLKHIDGLWQHTCDFPKITKNWCDLPDDMLTAYEYFLKEVHKHEGIMMHLIDKLNQFDFSDRTFTNVGYMKLVEEIYERSELISTYDLARKCMLL